ncbi:hypothetical protein [Glutamicibacter sp. TV12E]|uniref:hypothetical protein n=1 Tax=Glutamicibacter sp. TV12E TaxID=3446362 RepID=UPI004033A089
MMDRVRVKIAVGAITALPCLVLGLAVPAVADAETDRGLSYSLDGRSYAQNPPPIFAGVHALVPGDEVAKSLWIRNDRDREIEVSVRAVAPAASTEIYFTTVGASTFTLVPSGTTEVELRLGLPWSASNGSEDQQVPALEVRVDAVELAQEGGGPDAPGPEQEADLPDTGFSGAVLWAATGILALGGAVLAASRRMNRREQKRNGAQR